MMTHTGRILFTCIVCEFEASKQSMLENHMEAKHKKKDDEPKRHQCESCENTFPTLFHVRYHTCTPQFKYPCDKCEFKALSISELLTHVEQTHTKALVQCTYCEFKAKDAADLKTHIVTKHEDSAINYYSGKPTAIT